MKYKVTNNKNYNIYICRFEILPGESEIDCTESEADVVSNSNGLILTKIVAEKAKVNNLLKKKDGTSDSL